MVKAGTADIYNSVLDNPLTFVSGDFITAEMAADDLVILARTRNYLVAFGTQSIEYFFDAANPSGSPLNRNDTPFKQVGYLGGLAESESKLFFVGISYGSASNPEVFRMEDFKLEETSNPPLRRFTQPTSTFRGGIVSQGGRDFYIVNSSDITYMMDLETGIWTRLSYQDMPTFPLTHSSSMVRTGIGNTSVVSLEGSSKLLLFDPKAFTDDTEIFPVRLQTATEMFDSIHNKFMSRIVVVADQTAAEHLLSIRWTDDDYLTYSDYRTVELNNDRPALFRCGKFRRRAFDLLFEADSPFRIRHLEVDYNIGGR